MASTILFKFLGGLLTVGAVSAIPTAIIYSSNNHSKDEHVSPESLQNNCYTILTDWENKKHLLVCEKDSSLKYYFVNKNETSEKISEIQRINTSPVSVGVLGGGVIVETQHGGVKKNESLDGVKESGIMGTLHSLGPEGLHHKCKQINKGSENATLNCGTNKSIPLTKYSN